MNKNAINSKQSKKFHCSFENCIYRKGSDRHFKSASDLKQHLVKVHAEKKYLCEKCGKGFGSEWQQRYHERTCGIEWKCSCGQKYNRRETLLTHHRRTQHPYATDACKPKRSSSGKKNSAMLGSPTVIVLPVSHTVVYSGLPNIPVVPQSVASPVSTVNNTFNQNRFILPKEGNVFSNPSACSETVSETKCTEVSERSSETVNTVNYIKLFATIGTQTVSTESIETQTESQISMQRDQVKAYKKEQAAASTQTTRFFLESRGSQCFPRTQSNLRHRRRSYRGTSIETQTVESIVGRIKSSLHSKSRISTKTMKKNSAAQSVWSCLNKLLTSTLSRSSSGTQTSPRGKVLHNTCASQTLTLEGSKLSSEQTAHEMLGLLATVCQHLKDNSLAKENRHQAECEVNKPELMAKPNSENVISELLQVDNLKDVLSENFHLDEQEPDSMQTVAAPLHVAEENNIISAGTLLSDIETQTNAMQCSDYFSSNMETQTSEDTLLADMELSHIQTQTPWDFLDFCENINSNQLSADIQTDITGEDLTDIFQDALWSSSETTLADVTDMETQTHNQMPNMELISSYTQTLDNSFNLELPILK